VLSFFSIQSNDQIIYIQVKIDVDAFKANESEVLDSQSDIMDIYRGNHANNGYTTYARKEQERVEHLAGNTLDIPNPYQMSHDRLVLASI
jgi:hypothetical protein